MQWEWRRGNLSELQSLQQWGRCISSLRRKISLSLSWFSAYPLSSQGCVWRWQFFSDAVFISAVQPSFLTVHSFTLSQSVCSIVISFFLFFYLFSRGICLSLCWWTVTVNWSGWLTMPSRMTCPAETPPSCVWLCTASPTWAAERWPRPSLERFRASLWLGEQLGPGGVEREVELCDYLVKDSDF